MAYKKNYSTKKWYPKKQPIPTQAHKSISNPSDEQLAIFDFVSNNSDNLVIEAFAGCGKTATVVESMFRTASKGNVAYTVFNNKNAREAEGKVPPSVLVKTTHSLGLAALKNAYGLKHTDIDNRNEKSSNIATALVGADDEKTELRYSVVKAISLAKSYLAETEDDIITIVAKHGIDICDMSESEFSSAILEGLNLAAIQYRRVDFDDMIWLPIKKNIDVPQFDMMYVDECQDLNAARIALVLKSVKPGGRSIFVGDRFQAIYGFCGADSAAIDTIIEKTDATILPLSTTYRCPKLIVSLAQSVVSNYTASEFAPDGKITDCNEDYMMKNALPGDFILSRSNAPLIGTCLKFLKEGRKANILGRDLGRSLSYMIKRSNANDVDEFLSWLSDWKETECARISAKNGDTSVVVDKAECLESFCEETNSLEEVKKNISLMFDDESDSSRITLSTVHKAKGSERKKVWMLSKTFKPEKGGEEANIWYVCVTRVQEELFVVGTAKEQ